jgi:DNA-binding IclR family transcriptional regulator
VNRRVAIGEADGNDAAEARLGNRSVTRALAILGLLAHAGRPMTLAEIASEQKLPKSSVLSLLRALARSEFAVIDERGRYSVGLRSFEVGAAYLRSMTPVRAAESELQALTEALGATSHFAVLEGDEVVYLAKHDPPGVGLRLASSVGARLPAATTAVGKAQLAHRPRSSGGPGSPDGRGAARGPGTDRGLADELEAARALGYAVDEGQTMPGIRCVAAPVFSSGDCCGAIGVSYLIQSGLQLETAARAVVTAAGQASARLGGQRAGKWAG